MEITEETVITCSCGMKDKIKDLQIKMGGLICCRCRKILVWSHDPVYSQECKRRTKEWNESK